MQHMPVLACMHFYSIFNLQLFCPFFIFFNLVLKHQTETVWYQHLLDLFAIVIKSNTNPATWRLAGPGQNKTVTFFSQTGLTV